MKIQSEYNRTNIKDTTLNIGASPKSNPVGNVSGIANFYLYPGSLFAHSRPYMVSTILGSCVSICLWDPVLRIGGINHYLLPLWNGEGLPTPKYGNVAIERLIERMLSIGSTKNNLKAKVFGGSSLFNTSSGLLNIGQRNIQIAIDLLMEKNIPIISQDVGGSEGRRVLYFTHEGKVKVKNIKNTMENNNVSG